MTETTIWPEDGLRARIGELEAAKEAMRGTITSQTNIITVLHTHIDELKANLDAINSDLQDQVEYTIALRERAEKAEAALAERDTRRCEMCGHWGKHEMWPDQGWCPQHNEMDADCSCSEWTARAEEGNGGIDEDAPICPECHVSDVMGTGTKHLRGCPRAEEGGGR